MHKTAAHARASFSGEGMAHRRARRSMPRSLLYFIRKFCAWMKSSPFLLSAHFIPALLFLRGTKKEILKPDQNPRALLIELAKKQAPETKRRFKLRVTSPELWLSIVFGLGTRWTIRIALARAFGPADGWIAVAAVLFACAFAGLMAGIVTFSICALYRHAKGGRGEDASRALAASAVAGFFGGSIGGIAAHAGALLARSGGFAIGIGSGFAVFLLYNAMRSPRQEKLARPWRYLFMQSATFGAIGGIFGSISVEMFSIRASAAAPVLADPGMVTTYPPQLIIPQAGPVQSVIVAPNGLPSAIEAPPPEPAHHHPAAHHEPCPPKHVKHARPVKHVAPKPPETPTVQNIIIMQQAPQPLPQTVVAPPPPQDICASECGLPCDPPPPPQVVMPQAQGGMMMQQSYAPPYASQTYAPSYATQGYMPQTTVAPVYAQPTYPAQNYAAPGYNRDYGSGTNGGYSNSYGVNPYGPRSELDLSGPCGDPNVPCVQRVHFDENGDATKIVLEPGVTHASHFEVVNTGGEAKTNWNQAARASTASDESKVSLVMPFDKSSFV